MQLQQQVLHCSCWQGQPPSMATSRARCAVPVFAAQSCGAPRTRPALGSSAVLHVQTAVPAAPRHLQHSQRPGKLLEAVTAFSSSQQPATEDNTDPLDLQNSPAPLDSKQILHYSSRRSASRVGRKRSSSPGTAESGTPRHRSSSTVPGLGGRDSAINGVSKPQQSKLAKSDSSRGLGSKRSYDNQGRVDAAGVKSEVPRPGDAPRPTRAVTGSKVSQAALTISIKACTSTEQLRQLVLEHNTHLTYIHLAACITQLPKLQETYLEQQHGSKFRLLSQLWQLLQPKLQQCGTRQLSNVIWAVCKLKPSSSKQPQQEITEQCMTLFIRQLSTANAQDVSNILYGITLQGLDFPAMQMQQLMERFLVVSDQAAPQAISNTLWAVATLQQKLPTEQLQQLLAIFIGKLQQAKPQEISNTLWAVATMQQQLSTEQLHQLLAALVSQLQQAKPQAISNTLWAVATMQQQLPTEQLHQLLAALVSQLQQAKPQNVSNTLWAVATMQQQLTADQLQQLLAAFASQIQNAKPQAISNTLWAVATMQQQLPTEQLHQLLAALVSQLHQLKPQHISNTLWAVATIQQQLSTKQLHQLLAALVSKLQQATPQDISNALWAVATMQQQLSTKQLQHLLAAFIGKLQDAKPQNISITLWAIATMGREVPGIHLQQLLLALEGKVEQATPQDVSNAIWACGKLQYLPKSLLRAPQLLQELPAATPQGLASIAWALAALGHRDDQIMAAILHQAVQWEAEPTSTATSNAVDIQAICNVCWAVSVLDMRQYASYALRLVSAIGKQWPNISPEDLQQLYPVHTWLLDFQLVAGQGLQELLSKHQLQQCKKAWLASINITAAQVGSQLQQGVFVVVQRLPGSWSEPPAMEQLSRGRDGQEDGALLIDITARTAEGVLLAIEVDGPSHFRQPDGGLTGPTQYRNRALAARGYTVVSVPYHQWAKLQSNQQRQQYLMKLVQQAVHQQQVDSEEDTAVGTSAQGSTS